MDAKSIVEDVIKLDTERQTDEVELDGICWTNKLSKDTMKWWKTASKSSFRHPRKQLEQDSKEIIWIFDAIAPTE
jgi:DNA topoisomerase IB